MKNIKLTVLIVAFGLLIQTQTSFAQTVDERLKRATDMLNKNDSDGAMPDIEEVLKLQPTNALALNLRGLVNLRRKNYDQAIADFSQAITSDPKLTVAFYNRGMSNELKTNPDYKSAIADFSRAIELLPNYGDAFHQRGWACMQLQYWTAAEINFTAAIKYGINSREVYLNRGAARYNLGNYGQAAADYRKSLAIDPNYDLAKTKIAEAIAQIKQIPAQIQFDKLIVGELPKSLLANESPQMAETFARVVKLLNANDLDGAIKILNELGKTNPNSVIGYYLAGIIFYKQDNCEQAYTNQTKAIELNPNVAEFYYMRGLAVRYDPNTWNINELRNSIKDFTKAIEINPNYSDALRERAFACYFLYTGDFYTAFNAPYSYNSDIYSVLQLNPKDGEALYFDAVNIYYPPFIWDKKYKKQTNEMFVKMESDLTQAINSGTNRSSVYVLRGVANYFLNNRPQALADFQKALELDPNNTNASGNIKIFNSNPKEEFFFYIGASSLSPSSNPWTVKMNELYKLYVSAGINAKYYADEKLAYSENELCSDFLAAKRTIRSGIDAANQLWSLSRRESEKNTFLQSITTAENNEKKIDEWIRIKHCN